MQLYGALLFSKLSDFEQFYLHPILKFYLLYLTVRRAIAARDFFMVSCLLQIHCVSQPQALGQKYT